VYASPWSSPSPTQHSLPGGRYPLPGPDFHRLDRASFAWRTATAIPILHSQTRLDVRSSASIGRMAISDVQGVLPNPPPTARCAGADCGSRISEREWISVGASGTLTRLTVKPSGIGLPAGDRISSRSTSAVSGWRAIADRIRHLAGMKPSSRRATLLPPYCPFPLSLVNFQVSAP
jgi:hypothetical protein